ncbi:TetR/AcrR family transcriptional regulator [Kitasatospora sp. NPDC058965]|uniref:TetR/AcrR family transcriptional regulator n=1 Tax=Kitasatospora sp. NPDC058965 TaxID=3346682 RepID=UPI003696696B
MDGKQGYHHGNLRQALVAAGLTLARSGGPEAVGLREASRQAGVSHNAAYRHFADHRELVAAVAERCMQELGDLMRARTGAVTGGATERAWGRLDALGRAYVDFAHAEPGWFRTAFSAAAHPDPPGPPPELTADHPFQQLNAALDDLVAVGALPADRRPGAEYAAWSAVHGFAALTVEGPLRGMAAAETEQALRTVLAVVVRGL